MNARDSVTRESPFLTFHLIATLVIAILVDTQLNSMHWISIPKHTWKPLIPTSRVHAFAFVVAMDYRGPFIYYDWETWHSPIGVIALLTVALATAVIVALIMYDAGFRLSRFVLYINKAF